MPALLSQIPPPPPGNTGWPWTVESVLMPFELPAGQQWPKISIVTPSFNQGAYLEKTIRSVLLQGYPNLEYIIIDGGSTDNSVEIIKKYEPWLTYWASEKDRGQSHAINKGFEQATGNLLGWLNSDDWYVEGALFKIARAHIEDPSAGVIYGLGHVVDDMGKLVHSPEHIKLSRDKLFDWAFGSNFMQPSSLFLRKAWLDCGPLDESLDYALDFDLWLKISRKYQFHWMPDLLSLALSHSRAKTAAQAEEMYVDLAMVMMRHGNEAAARKTLGILVEKVCDQNRKLNTIRRLPGFEALAALINAAKRLNPVL